MKAHAARCVRQWGSCGMANRKTKGASPATGGTGVLGTVLWLVAICAWILVTAALLSYNPADSPSHLVARHHEAAANWVGPFGALVAHKIYLMLGPGVWLLVIGSGAWMVRIVQGRRPSDPVLRAIGLVLAAVATSALIALWAPSGLPLFASPGGRPEGSGGMLALLIQHELVRRFSLLGTTLILGSACIIGFLLAADHLVLALSHVITSTVTRVARAKVPQVKLPALPSLGGLLQRLRPAPAGADSVRLTDLDDEQIASGPDDPGDDLGDEEEDDDEEDEKDEKAYEEEAVFEETTDDGEVASGQDDSEPESNPEDGPDGSKHVYTKEELREKIRKLPVQFAGQKTQTGTGGATGGGISREVDLSGYKFPDLSLLEDWETGFGEQQEMLVRDQAVTLEAALQEYRIEGEVVGIDSGPVITMYEVRLAPGTKVSRLNVISSDLARALKSQNIRIVPNMVGKDTVGIEVPNLKKEQVRIRELMTATPEAPRRMKIPMWLGKDASGNALVVDLATMPHMLIAGTTGSGKSVCMNSIIMSFLFTKRPDEMKLVLVDPKMVEMSMFKEIPHLMCPVVTEMTKATAILEWATTKMDERYELLAEAGVRDVASYNALTWEVLKERFNPETEEEEARIPRKLPYIVFVIDELADLMMTAKEVEGFIVRLAQKARAVGIHLILATQRPQANVVTGLIKGNMPCRISFKVASGLDSRIVLDQKGAELLLGQGDMLYLSPRTSKLMRAQGTLVDDLEIRRVVRFLKQVAEPNFEPQLVQLKSAALTENQEERDPMFDEAVRVVLETKRGSVSLLQRRLTVGYSRASRLIEQMAVAGIIGDYKGSQAREVTMTLEEYEALLAQAQEDAESSGGTSTGSIRSSQATNDEEGAIVNAVETEEEVEEEEDVEEEHRHEGDGEETEEEEAEEEEGEDDEYEYEYEYEEVYEDENNDVQGATDGEGEEEEEEETR